MSTGDRSLEVGGRRLSVSRPDKRMFEQPPLDKWDLVRFARRIAGVALPHLRDRPLSLERFPDGIAGEGFIQKDTPEHFPSWLETVTLPKRDGSVRYALAQDAASLCYVMEQACLTLHVMSLRRDDPDHPDRVILDLDPADGDVEGARFAARAAGGALRERDLAPYLQTTGSRGFHVVAPLDRSADFDDVRAFAAEVAAELAEKHPDRLTDEQRLEARGGRVYIDVMRNAYGQTAVAPYSLRVRPGAPVATPLRWREIGSVGPRSYHLGNIFRRLGQTDDPWRDIDRHARRLRR